MARALYLHVPFCTSRCGYCGFYSGEPLAFLAEYPDWVLREADLRYRQDPTPRPLASVYFGGGTPALLGPGSVERILAGVERLWGLAPGAEVTIEVNPSSGADLDGLLHTGVNRLSVGVQALDDRILARLGRRHGGRDALDMLSAATRGGFESVNADLLYGLPDLNPEDLAAWVDQISAQGVSHLSGYSLEVHAGTELERQISTGLLPACAPSDEQAQWESVVETAAARGYHPYEVSNFARPGAESRHNQMYWDRGPYLGLGPGAHSFAPESGPWGRRFWNDAGLRSYGEAVCRGDFPPGGAEELTRAEALLEALFLGFRRPEPLPVEAWATEFDLQPERITASLAVLAEDGLLIHRGGGSWGATRGALRRADGVALWLHTQLVDTDEVSTRSVGL